MKKNILITGASGFIGKKIYLELKKKKNLSIRKIKLSNTKYNNFKILEETLNEKFKKIDIIIHLAWGNMKDPWSEDHLKNNFKKTQILFNHAKKSKVKKFIFCGSMNEYGDVKGSISERKKTGKIETNYAKSKYKLTKLGMSFFKNSFTEFYSIRPFYVYGHGQEKNSLINQLFRAAKIKHSIKLSSCDAYRDYIYVNDVVSAFVLVALSKNKLPGIYNVGSGKAIKLKSFVKLIWKNLGIDSKLLKFGKLKNKKEQVQLKSFSNNLKIYKNFNWKPKYNLNKGIKDMINIYNSR